MKHLCYLSLFIVLSACNADSSSESNQSNSAVEGEMPVSFYKSYEGKIGDYPIVMSITKKDSTITGSYYYTKIGMPLSLYGNLNADGQFVLTESNGRYEETGHFKGSFKDDLSISGTWSNAAGDKSFGFSLKERQQGVATIEFDHRNSKNCHNIEGTDLYEEFGEEELCTTLELDLVHINFPKEDIMKKVNRTILREVCNFSFVNINDASIDALMNTVNDTNQFGYELGITCYPVTNEEDILTIGIGQYYYAYGAAHPVGQGDYYNFDLKTGAVIGLDQLLNQGFEDDLNRIAEPLFIENNGDEGWYFEPGNFKLNRDFAITPGGLLFSFDQYEIAPYVFGSPEVFIPYSKIKDLIVPDGLLARFLK